MSMTMDDSIKRWTAKRKTSLTQLRDVGASSTAMIAGQTLFLAGLVLLGLWVLG